MSDVTPLVLISFLVCAGSVSLMAFLDLTLGMEHI